MQLVLKTLYADAEWYSDESANKIVHMLTNGHLPCHRQQWTYQKPCSLLSRLFMLQICLLRLRRLRLQKARLIILSSPLSRLIETRRHHSLLISEWRQIVMLKSDVTTGIRLPNCLFSSKSPALSMQDECMYRRWGPKLLRYHRHRPALHNRGPLTGGDHCIVFDARSLAYYSCLLVRTLRMPSFDVLYVAPAFAGCSARLTR